MLLSNNAEKIYYSVHKEKKISSKSITGINCILKYIKTENSSFELWFFFFFLYISSNKCNLGEHERLTYLQISNSVYAYIYTELD